MLAPDAHTLSALLLLGVAWAFLRADATSATSRALAAALACGGLAVLANRLLVALIARGPLPDWAALLVLPEAVAFCAAFEWVLGIRRTIPAGRLRTRFGDHVLRAAQALALLYACNALRHPEMRLRDFYGSLGGGANWSGEVFVLFAAPLMLALLLWALSVVLCLQRAPAPAERARLVAFLVAVPIIAAALVLPSALMPLATVLGVIVLLGGALRHAELRGVQDQFLRRFLSPQVLALAHADGLARVLPEERRDISVVAVDLRGFTAYAARRAPEQVIALLRAYYDAVGAAVSDAAGTIKDYAGDGVLILVGAPLALPDHRERAWALAAQIVARVEPLLLHYAPAAELGVGAGVASGEVALGLVGGAGPLEYAAVGNAVNLAARLAERARPGTVLVAMLEPMAASDARLRAGPPLDLKGYDTPVPVAELLRTGA